MLQFFTLREAGRPGNHYCAQLRNARRSELEQRPPAERQVAAERQAPAEQRVAVKQRLPWPGRRWLAWSCVLVFLLHGARTRAAEPAAPRAFEAGKVELNPEHRQVAWPEYILAPLLIAGAFGQSAFFKPSSSVDWRGPILFDRRAQQALRVQSPGARQVAHQTSNVLLASSALQAMVVDPWIVAGWIHGRPDVAWQLTVINAEAFGLTEFSNRLAKELVRRERPYGETCEPGSPECETDARNRSFFSGHASASATFAGLTCAHHQRLALYGSFAADLGACMGALGVSLGAGMLRITSDNHWASDVLLGHLVGFSTGYLLTSALYYAAPPQEDVPVQPRPMVAPIIGAGVLGLAVQSRF